MPETVVDHLEAVQVQKQNGYPLASALIEHPLKAIHQQHTVRPPGQRVMMGLVPELRLNCFGPGDIP